MKSYNAMPDIIPFDTIIFISHISSSYFLKKIYLFFYQYIDQMNFKPGLFDFNQSFKVIDLNPDFYHSDHAKMNFFWSTTRV